MYYAVAVNTFVIRQDLLPQLSPTWLVLSKTDRARSKNRHGKINVDKKTDTARCQTEVEADKDTLEYLIASFGTVYQDLEGESFLCRLLHTHPGWRKQTHVYDYH